MNFFYERGFFFDDYSFINFSVIDNCDLEGIVVENEVVERLEGEKFEELIFFESDSCSFKCFEIL